MKPNSNKKKPLFFFKPIAAFTLMEVLVGLVLFAIISSMSIQGIIMTRKQFFAYKQQQDEITTISDFIHSMKIDIYTALYVERYSQELHCTFNDKKIVYTLNPRVTFRSNTFGDQTLIDTFDISALFNKTSFNSIGKEIGLVNELEIDISDPFTLPTVYLKKEYSAHNLINYFNNGY